MCVLSQCETFCSPGSCWEKQLVSVFVHKWGGLRTERGLTDNADYQWPLIIKVVQSQHASIFHTYNKDMSSVILFLVIALLVIVSLGVYSLCRSSLLLTSNHLPIQGFTMLCICVTKLCDYPWQTSSLTDITMGEYVARSLYKTISCSSNPGFPWISFMLNDSAVIRPVPTVSANAGKVVGHGGGWVYSASNSWGVEFESYRNWFFKLES